MTEKEKHHVLDVLKMYDFGKNHLVHNMRRNAAALVNDVYLLYENTGKYIIRISPPETESNHILLEVELLHFLSKQKFSLAPRVIKNANGENIMKKNDRNHIIQTCMPGKMVANWDNLANFNIAKLESFFKASALFSKTTQNFHSEIQMNNFSLADSIEIAQDDFEKKLMSLPQCSKKMQLEKMRYVIQAFIQQTSREFVQCDYRHLPTQLVHFDFHPGNVHFIKDRVSGIFDYDWIRFDSRITEIAGTIAQSCCYYGGKRDGLYRKDRIHIGLAAYRKAYRNSEFQKKEENELIKVALKAYIIFQLLFSIDEYAKHTASKRHENQLDHFVKLIISNNYNSLFA